MAYNYCTLRLTSTRTPLVMSRGSAACWSVYTAPCIEPKQQVGASLTLRADLIEKWQSRREEKEQSFAHSGKANKQPRTQSSSLVLKVSRASASVALMLKSTGNACEKRKKSCNS